MIPSKILEKIEDLAREIPLKQLAKAALELSNAYRLQSIGEKKGTYMEREHKLAYLALRFPATYAAAYHILKMLPQNMKSLLDFGSGPGTVLIAASTLFKDLKTATLVEKDAELKNMSSKLLSDINISKNILQHIPSDEKKYSLTVASYALSELPKEELFQVVDALWEKTSDYLAIIEPGTPYGFHLIHEIRTYLIGKGATIFAPCTHEKSCPLFEKNDFCHFSVRLNRTFLQRRVKAASLGYEDEKFSYLIISKEKRVQTLSSYGKPFARVIKTPMQRSGHVKLTLCSEQGYEETIFSKKLGDIYQIAKRMDWGASFPENAKS